MCLQMGISTNILAKWARKNLLQKKALQQIVAISNCDLDNIVKINQENEKKNMR